MNDRELRRFNAGIRMSRFRNENAAVNANQEAKAAFDAIDAAIAKMQPAAAAQTSGEGKRLTAVQSVSLDAVNDDLKKIARTAKALSVRNPGFKDLFPFPRHLSIQETLATAREVAAQAETHKSKFISYGMRPDFVEKLNSDIAALEAAVNEKAAAKNAGVSATADLDAEFEKLMEAREILTGIIPNLFENNPGKLAEWKSASHVQRTPAPNANNNSGS